MATNTNPFYTYSATAGSSKTLQKPQDGGDNNQWGNYINTDLDEIVSAVNALSDKIADASENTLVDFTATGSAVNHVGITNAATGNGPTISTAGTDSNVDLNVTPKGTGDSVFTNKIKVDDVIEKTTDHGVEIEGVLVKDSIVKTDDIQEKTTDHGVEIDGVTLKDGGGTFSGDVAINSAKIEVTQPASDQSGGAAIKAIGTAYSTNKAFHAYMNTANASKSLIYAENSSGGVLNVAGDGNVGIGTTSPNGTLTCRNDNANTSQLILGNTLNTGGRDWRLGRDNASTGDFIVYSSDDTDSNNTTERMRIDSSNGDVTVNTGNLVIGTAGKGIDFSNQTGTSNPDSGGEVLSHYEEGTFTATLGYGPNTITTATGTYTKIGNVCTLGVTFGALTNSSTSGGSPYISGLPFSNGAYTPSSSVWSYNFFSGTTTIHAVGFSASNSVSFLLDGSFSNATMVNLSSSYVAIGMTYITA